MTRRCWLRPRAHAVVVGLVLATTLALPWAALAQAAGPAGTPDDLPDTAFDEGGCVRGEIGAPSWALNLATLQLSVEAVDSRFGGRGPDVRLRRVYSASQDRSGMFGSVWQADWEARITRSQDGARLVLAGGRVVSFEGSLWDSGASAWRTTDVVLTTGDRLRYRLTYEGARPGFVLDDPRTRWLWRFDRVDLTDAFRLGAISDRHGNTVVFSYSGTGEAARLQQVVDAMGRTTFFGYDGAGRVTSVTAPDGRVASYGYDSAGHLTDATDFAGGRSAFAYDGAAMVTLDAAGRTTRFEWTGSAPRLVSAVVDPSLARTSYSLDASTGRVTITGPLGFAREVEHQQGRRTRETDGWWREVRTEYADDRPVRIVDGNAATTFEYDPAGNLARRVDPMGRATGYTWNAQGLVTRVSDATGAAWTYAYDDRLNLTETVTPSGVRTRFEYDGLGQLLRVYDSQGRARTLTWSARGDPELLTDRAGRVLTFTHDDYGRLQAVRTRTGGEPVAFGYDALDRLASVAWGGPPRRIAYDGCAVATVTDELGATTRFAWDGRWRALGVTDPTGGTVSLLRDTDGAITAIRDPLGRETRTTLERASRALQHSDAASAAWRAEYDASGRLLRLTDPRNGVTAQVWNLAGELTAVQDAVASVETYERDPLGRVAAIQTGANRRAVFAYDADGRRVTVTHDTVVHRSVYDSLLGHLIEREDAGRLTSFAYDAEGRVSTATWRTGGLQASFARDAGGRVGAIGYPGALAVSYTYDARERVRTVTIGGATSTFTYDAADRLAAIVRPQGIESGFAWDAAGRAIGIRHRSTAAGTFVDLVVTRDAAGNVRGITGTEPRQRSAQLDVPPTLYNLAGQIANRGGQPYTYVAGDLVAAGGARPWSATYDPEHRMASLTRAGETVAFAWDADARRVARVASSSAREFHYGPDGTLLFESENGQLRRRYVYVDRRLFAMVEADGTVRYFHFDHLGSTLAITDASGAIVGAWGYDPSGRATAQAGSPTMLFTFAGEHGVQDEGDGFFVMGSRVYDAATLRFVQRRTRGLSDGPNPYEYAGGNPATFLAPDGGQAWMPTATAGMAGGAFAVAGAWKARHDAEATPGPDLAWAAARTHDLVPRQVGVLQRWERRGQPLPPPWHDPWLAWGLLR